ncbi:MAG: hypothetical protein ACPG8W_00505 [Candidatus Promineifilaceae bacterium]
MTNWEYRRIIIVNKSLGNLRFVDSSGDATSIKDAGFVRTSRHAAKIADYLSEVSKDGWEIASHAITDGLQEEIFTLRRAI